MTDGQLRVVAPPGRIRNSAVAWGTAGTGYSDYAYTVPSGFVLLLRSVLVTSANLAWSDCGVFIITPGLGPIWVFYDAPPPYAYKNWSGWVPVNGGDELHIVAHNDTVTYYMGGALLPWAPGLITP